MHILSIDAATKTMGVSIVTFDKLIASTYLNVGKTHSQRLLPALADLLKSADLELGQMQAIAVTIGPGSFTGLRIGLATAKALAEALGKKIIPIITLDALAYNAREYGDLICPVLDARKNEVYFGLYDSQGKLNQDYGAKNPRFLAEELNNTLETGSKVVFLGDAADVYWQVFQECLGDKARLMPPANRMNLSVAAGFLALEKFDEAIPPQDVKAFYLRVSEAEARRNATLKG